MGIPMLKFAKPNNIILFFLILSLNACSSLPLIEIGSSLQTVTTNKLTKGLVFYKVNKGKGTQTGHYTLTSNIISVEKAEKLNKQLNEILTKEKYFELLDLINIIKPEESAPHGQSLGKILQLGNFETIEHAKIIQKFLAKYNVKLAVLHTSLQGGPFDISILRLSLKNYKGQLISSLGHNQITVPERTSSIANKVNAIAAVNAGFFVFDTKLGIVGDPAGISVIDGKLVSEAVNGRPALLIRNKPILSVDILESVTTKQILVFENEKILINGINRALGKILNCGQQTENIITPAIHDYLCENNNEIIIYDHTFGELSMLENIVDFSFFIDKNNEIYGVNDNSINSVPHGHYLIKSTGTKAQKLRTLIKTEKHLKVDFKIESKKGEIKLEKGMYIVNGGPTLLQNGKENIKVRSQEGWDIKEFTVGRSAEDNNDKNDQTDTNLSSRKQFYYNWMVRRHPRTAVGTTKNGDTYFVVVYGRNPRVSAGASVTEMAKIMKSLNVDKAINLDGGGSSVMIVDGKITGIPSDVEGERAVGDALLFLPSKISH
jgi:exopolysaccharide biosynthesis protein